MLLGSNSLFTVSTTLGSIYRLGHWYAGIDQRLNLISCSKRYNSGIKTLTYVNVLKFLISVACVRQCRHIETQSIHVLTGAYVSNQSTNGGVRQQWFGRLDIDYDWSPSN